jgi:hypothetical protein
MRKRKLLNYAKLNKFGHNGPPQSPISASPTTSAIAPITPMPPTAPITKKPKTLH